MSPLSWFSLSPPSPSHCSRLLQKPNLNSMNLSANFHWLSFLHMLSMFPGYSLRTLWSDFSSFFFDWGQLSHIFCWTLMLITWDDKPSTSYSVVIRSRSPWILLFHFIFPTLLCLWKTSFDLMLSKFCDILYPPGGARTAGILDLDLRGSADQEEISEENLTKKFTEHLNHNRYNYSFTANISRSHLWGWSLPSEETQGQKKFWIFEDKWWQTQYLIGSCSQTSAIILIVSFEWLLI